MPETAAPYGICVESCKEVHQGIEPEEDHVCTTISTEPVFVY